ncbi:MAG: polysaccharide deacetylase family protein [Treponema sp.]|nr:polysaccharide deacetylase family protein [Treponema sp.]
MTGKSAIRVLLCLLVLLPCAGPGAAQDGAGIRFGNIDINAADNLLFTASQEMPGSGNCTSLFLARLGPLGAKESPRILTCWPERLETLGGGRILQVRNRYGTVRYTRSAASLKNSTLKWTQWDAAAGTLPVSHVRTGPVSASPNGNWLCYVQKTFSAEGQLMLQNAVSGEQRVLVDKVPFSYGSVQVKWSPDSSFLLYEKDGTLYFVNPSIAFGSNAVAEEYRRIGPGSVRNAVWTGSKSLVYISGDIVYCIQEDELYIRGLYSSFIGSGSIVGRLLLPFDPARDSFWCDDEGKQLVVNTGGKFLSFCTVNRESYDYVQLRSQFSFSRVNGSVTDCMVFWADGQKPFLWVSYIPYSGGSEVGAVFELSSDAPLRLDQHAPLRPQLSPDGSRIALIDGDKVSVYRLKDWMLLAECTGERVISLAWASSGSIYVGGAETVRLWSFSDTISIAPVLFLSSVAEACWDGGRIVARTASSPQLYVYDTVRGCWNTYDRELPAAGRSEKNGNFRVYAAAAKNRKYANALFVRHLSGDAYTYPLYVDTQDTAPERKKIALVFDAVDSAEGLARILSVLGSFRVKATFFINGEFIRRYPMETKLVADSGNDCASAFCSNVNLLSKEYRIDTEFIRRGLARNEDEFFAVTGREFSLLWHAPSYQADRTLVAAGQASGYRYVDAASNYFDKRILQSLGTSNYIDACISMLYDGMILPFTVGNATGDVLYEHFDLFLAALLDSGCEIVGIESLLD